MKRIDECIERFRNNRFEKEDLVYILSLEDERMLAPLYAYSARLCEKVYGRDVYIRGLIEFSNVCRRNCCYCGLRRENSKLKRYRAEFSDIYNSIKEMNTQGVKTVVLQSGEHLPSDELMLHSIKYIKDTTDMAVTLSIGERSRESYTRFKDAGADRFLLRIETTDPALFKTLHPDDILEERKNCLLVLKELGYELGTGIMVGLPGQNVESIADDLLYFKELQPEMVGIGPFIPHQDTPLVGNPAGTMFMTLKTLSLIRVILPTANLPATTAMGSISKTGRQRALKVGANVIMPNYTHPKFHGMYDLYDGKVCVSEDPAKNRVCAEKIAAAAGKKIVDGIGQAKKVLVGI